MCFCATIKVYMVNTVGSRKTKYWTGKWKPIKDSLFLTEKQRQLIIGSLLGDGTMYIPKKGRNANFKVEQGLKQKEFVEWKYTILRNWVFTEPKISFRYKENREKYAKSWWFRTLSHPLLTEIHNKFYQGESHRNRTKIIPRDLGKDLTPFSLAVLIMDDGSYSKKKIDISTYTFSLSDIIFLQQLLKDKFDLESNYYRDRDKGYRMYFRKTMTDELIRIIYPFIIPSMQYKIGFTTP